MKRLTIIATMMVSFPAFGQDTIKPTVSLEFGRLLFGVNISPDYCYRTLSNNDGSTSGSWIIDLRNDKEVPKIGYTAGLNICYNISRLLGIEAGLQYSNKGYASEKYDLIFGELIDPRYGFVYPGNSSATPVKVKFKYNHIYLDVPVRAIFSFGGKRVHFVTSIGVTTNILLKATQTSYLEYDNGDTKRQTQDQQYDFKTLNISPTISAGTDYRISNKINLRAELTFRYGILKIIDTPIAAYLWSGGLNITCYYAIK